MTIGCLCKAAYGVLVSLVIVIFGDFLGGVTDFFQLGIRLTWQLGCFAAGAFLLEATDNYLIELAKHRQVAKWKKEYVWSILRQDVGWFDVNEPQQLAARMGDAIVKIEKGLSVATSNIFLNIAQGSAGIALGVYYKWDVALVATAIAAFTFVPAMLGQMRAIAFKSVRSTEAYAVAGGIASEVLGALRTVASFGLEPQSLQRYVSKLRDAEKAGLQSVCTINLFSATADSAMYYVLGGGLLYGVIRMYYVIEDSSFTWTPGGNHYCALACDQYNAYQLWNDGNYSAQCTSGRGGFSVEPFKMSCALAGSIHGQASIAEALLPYLTSPPLGATSNITERLAIFDHQFYEAGGEPTVCGYDITSVYVAVNAVFTGVFALSQIGVPLKDLTEARVAVTDVVEVINSVPNIDPFSDNGKDLTRVDGRVELVNVNFAYPAAPDYKICHGFSLTIPAGESCALCGPSGSGKSTIMALLERFYDPEEGQVLLDGIDIRLVKVKELRRCLGLVGQEPLLFLGSVAYNIRLGRQDATQQEIQEAARMANAHEFITELSNSYDTEVGLGGGQLSGGQKQRIAIARAIIKKPAVMLLDEATSALDNTAEKIVQAALDKIMAESRHTTITVAHRLTTIRHCDKIAVVKKGKVVEHGTWDQLMSRGEGGIFHGLAIKQQEQMMADEAIMSHMSITPSGSAADLMSSSGANTMRSSFAHAGSVTADRDLDGEPRATPPRDLDGEPSAPPPRNATCRLLSLNPGDWWLYVIGAICGVISGGIKGGLGMLITSTVQSLKNGSPDQLRSEAVLWAFVFVVLGFFNNVIEFVGQYCLGVTGEHLTKSLRCEVMSTLLRKEVGYFDENENSVGTLSEFLGKKVYLVQGLMGEKIGMPRGSN